jgi:SAM-dependent methyltransferase
VSFEVPAELYDRLMGRYSMRLAPLFADFAGLGAAAAVLDVGCGPGALTSELARRAHGGRVAAVDPSESFVAACRSRVPEADVRQAPAEALPFEDDAFDGALSQLVVNFMADPDAGVREMRRVIRPGGTAAACVWERGRGMRLFHAFSKAALSVDPDGLQRGPADRFRSGEELRDLWLQAGFEEVATAALDVEAEYADFDDLWAGLTTGIGPHSAYLVSLGEERRAAVREACRAELGLPDGPFSLPARAWAVRGRVG